MTREERIERLKTDRTCTVCGKPLSDALVRLAITAHFSCIVESAYGDDKGGRE